MSRMKWKDSLAQLSLASLFLLLPSARPSYAALKPEEVPLFDLRVRVVSVARAEAGDRKFNLTLAGQHAVAEGNRWSDWMSFGLKDATDALKAYPNLYLNRYPVVTQLTVDGVVDTTIVEAELRLQEAGEVIPLRSELFGTGLGILLWRDDAGKPQAATMAGYNRQYWKALEGVQVPAESRLTRFPIVDRFIGGDDDALDWKEGLQALSKAGFSAIMLPPSKPIRQLLLDTGIKRTAWGIYNPPGYAFDYDPKITAAAIHDWAAAQAKTYTDAGYDPKDVALFAMSDEPGWYYPSMFKEMTQNPVALERFRQYLRDQKLKPADLGAKAWTDVMPLGRGRAITIAARRLFYWTMRFFSWDSERHFANCSRALEGAFYPGFPAFTNWNFFAGRFYVPGPVANNADKTSPDAGMGGHDWLEFGRMRGSTTLWTEDWFDDGKAYQWSFYASKLRCAAEKSGVNFGGYVVPRASGSREDGLLQKTLCLVGSGAKAVEYYVFGPEYNFPGNCYSDSTPKALAKLAEANRMIGATEDLLWPGKRARSPVAILMPRSAGVWDPLVRNGKIEPLPTAGPPGANAGGEAHGATKPGSAPSQPIPITPAAPPAPIQDATNNDLNGSTVDYMAEVADLYLALQHANVPCDFVDEDDLTTQGLQPYRVLYVTEPDIPVEGQRALVAWTRSGGTLVTVPGAGSRDRYDEPSAVLSKGLGVQEADRQRMLVPDLASLQEVGKVSGGGGQSVAVGVRSVLIGHRGPALGTFEDGSPAVVAQDAGKGRVIHFGWMPGLSYRKSSVQTADGLPVGFSSAIRDWILYPIHQAKVEPPVTVSHSMIETPLLLSDAGGAMTLLNWSGEAIPALQVQVQVPFRVKSVQSVQHGPLPFQTAPGGVSFSLPLGAADVVMVRR